jgi:acetyltransferase
MPDKTLKSTGITLDGTPIALRPLLPEDEPALQDLFAHMSREDVRLRFFTPMRELKHALDALRACGCNQEPPPSLPQHLR